MREGCTYKMVNLEVRKNTLSLDIFDIELGSESGEVFLEVV